MSLELYGASGHTCVLFTNLVPDDSDAVQSNQVLIVDQGRGMLLDPGGVITYNELFLAMSRFFTPKDLQYVFASHADPDIVASLPRWLQGSTTRLVISRLWSRFVTHFCPAGKTEGRIIEIPDRGGVIELGRSRLFLLPAHFLHAEGNFQVYDPVSRILFSGDLGASITSSSEAARPVDDFDRHVVAMANFHRRYMASSRACALWANMARTLNIEMIVPQHGAPIRGKAAVTRFIDWISQLQCGVDLLTQESYQVPSPKWRLGDTAASTVNTSR